jgi:hypothetical protein
VNLISDKKDGLFKDKNQELATKKRELIFLATTRI